jgi:glycerol-1-phosphate dehydrogenase [NAD(P)+]
MTAARLERPYAVFGTAPSMNGYASVSASIAIGGFKQSLPARAPAGVFLDLTVLAHAPLRLIRGGLGECVCRSTAQADWLLAHLLLDQPYRDVPFALLAAEEEELFASSEALVAGDLDAMGRLARTLVLSGFGMTICGGSYPASQGEHLIAHYMGMMSDDTDSLHGEQIGVSALAMAALQQRVLAMDTPPVVQPSRLRRDDLHAHFGPELGQRCWQEFSRKQITAARARQLNDRLAAGWDDIRARLAAVTRPPGDMRATLERAGAPVAPHDLGWPASLFRAACEHARELRNRFTFLDLAADSGIAILLQPGHDENDTFVGDARRHVSDGRTRGDR